MNEVGDSERPTEVPMKLFMYKHGQRGELMVRLYLLPGNIFSVSESIDGGLSLGALVYGATYYDANLTTEIVEMSFSPDYVEDDGVLYSEDGQMRWHPALGSALRVMYQEGVSGVFLAELISQKPWQEEPQVSRIHINWKGVEGVFEGAGVLRTPIGDEERLRQLLGIITGYVTHAVSGEDPPDNAEERAQELHDEVESLKVDPRTDNADTRALSTKSDDEKADDLISTILRDVFGDSDPYEEDEKEGE